VEVVEGELAARLDGGVARGLEGRDEVGTSLATADASPPAFSARSVRKASGSSANTLARCTGLTKIAANWSRDHSMQWSMRCGKLRSVHMGIPPPSTALPPSRYVLVVAGTMGSTLPEVPMVPDSRRGLEYLTQAAST